MLEKVLENANLRLAWKKVRANKGASGIDGITVEEFREKTRESWPDIRETLLEQTYQPQLVRRVEIPKHSGGKRPLGIPIVLDRLITQAILQELQPIFEGEFSNSSYGFRPNRSAHDAVKEVRFLMDKGYTWVVDIDLSKFFDRVDTDLYQKWMNGLDAG